MKKKIFISMISLSLILLIGLSVCVFNWFADYKKSQDYKKAVLKYRQEKINLFIKQNEKFDDYEIDVAFLGDSLTDGYDLEKFYPQHKVVNRGIAGDTTFDLEKRLKVSAYDLKPKVLVMLIGANNFKTMFKNYERMVISIKENLPNTEIVLLSLTAMSKEWGKNNALACFNNIKIQQIAEKQGCTFVDLFNPLFDLETNGIHADFTTDGGHLTEKGYEVITQELAPVLDFLLTT